MIGFLLSAEKFWFKKNMWPFGVVSAHSSSAIGLARFLVITLSFAEFLCIMDPWNSVLMKHWKCYMWRGWQGRINMHIAPISSLICMLYYSTTLQLQNKGSRQNWEFQDSDHGALTQAYYSSSKKSYAAAKVTHPWTWPWSSERNFPK